MNWEAIGAVGEVVGATAVVATLAYFAFQILDAKRASQSQATINATQLASSWRSTLLANSDLATVLAKANVSEELSGKERIQLHNLADELFFACAAAHSSSLHAGSIHNSSGASDYLVSLIGVNPALIGEWQRLHEQMFPPSFVEAIDRQIEGGSASARSIAPPGL